MGDGEVVWWVRIAWVALVLPLLPLTPRAVCLSQEWWQTCSDCVRSEGGKHESSRAAVATTMIGAAPIANQPGSTTPQPAYLFRCWLPSRYRQRTLAYCTGFAAELAWQDRSFRGGGRRMRV